MSSAVFSKVEEMRSKILEDYKDTAFRKELWPDPPLRGTYGMATIPLKECAIPFTAKAFCMHGERAEAYKKVVQDWLDRGFIERGRPCQAARVVGARIRCAKEEC